jgi:hypothetical protein
MTYLSERPGVRLPAFSFGWRGRVILRKLIEGCTSREAAAAVGISKQALLKRMNVSPDFKEAVTAAREAGKDERTFRLWLRHPFRGLRPPTGKGHGGKPRFTYGRR